MSRQLIISLDGYNAGVPAKRLLEAIHATLGVLEGLDVAASSDGARSLDWSVVKAATNSPLAITLEPRILRDRPDTTMQVMSRFFDGWRRLEKGEPAPRDFNRDVLRQSHALVKLLELDRFAVRFDSPGFEQLTPTLRSAATIEESLSRDSQSHVLESTVEGRLETVTIHGGEAIHVCDILTGSKVRCKLDEAQLKEAISPFGKRVSIRGRAKFNEQGRPFQIDVDSIRVLRDRSALPRPQDFEGPGRIDLLDGFDADEFYRRLKDA